MRPIDYANFVVKEEPVEDFKQVRHIIRFLLQKDNFGNGVGAYI